MKRILLVDDAAANLEVATAILQELEAIKAQPTTQSIPVLICPVAGWLLAGHETRVALHRVHVWPEGFALDALLETVQLALAGDAVPAAVASVS